MHEQNSEYPVKVISRTLSPARSARLRISWFVLGTAFGMGCMLAASPLLHSTSALVKVDAAPAAPQATAGAAAPIAATSTADEAAITDIISQAPEADDPEIPEIAADNTPPGDIYPLIMNLKVENGDTLISMLTDAGVTYDEAHAAIASMRAVYDPKKLDIGQNITVHLDKSDKDKTPFIASLSIPASLTSTVEIKRKAGSDGVFTAQKVDTPVDLKLARAGGRIDSSLYDTGVGSGLPPSLLNELITAYSYDVDFQREIQPGDGLDVLFERYQTKDGDTAGHGNVLYAELNLGDKVLRIYRFTDKTGNSDYYNEKGESVRKALLRTPINGARITSGFGMRSHPILGYSKMHRGIDFGAPTGTPIYAAGDGTVSFVGQKGGYGNYLRIQHNGKYSSAYGHISRFASGMAPGRKVRQGQIVAYVGSTGMATGPHLHYEILVGNEQVNPAGMKFKTGNVLAGKELASFKQNISRIESKLAEVPRKTDVAMAQGQEN